jgi:hypothetical protein
MVGAAVVACGSQAGEGLNGGELAHDLGYVGSGGAGSHHDRDGGELDAGKPPGHLDGGSVDGSPHVEGGPGGSNDGGSNDGATGGVEDASVDAPGDGGSSVNVTFSIPPGLFASLDWVISGPSGYYSGTVYFGQAHSIEFVAGGIHAGSGYRLTLAGTDRYGDPCSGTSAPFDVIAGQVSGAGVVLTCDVPTDAEAADVATGSVGVEAGVVLSDM